VAKTKKGLLIRDDGYMAMVEIGSGLSDYYRLIETDIVERAYLTIRLNGREVSFEGWCDEEGFLHRKEVNFFIHALFGRVIVGNVVIHGRSLAKLVSHMEDQGYTIDTEVSDDDVSAGEGSRQE
jgi:hypothetical protein